MSEASFSLLLEPDALEPHLNDPGLLVVDLRAPQAYAAGHVPGAVNLNYAEIVRAAPPAMGLLPDEKQLGAVLSRIGLTPETHLVAYDDEGNGRAARLLWTLDALGHTRFSLLNGGLVAWAREGHALEREIRQPTASRYNAAFANPDAVADKDYVLSRLGQPDLALLDARTPAEYQGTDVRAARGGHIPGAVNMNWTDAIDTAGNLRFKPAEALRPMLEGLGVTPDKEVIVYCQTHHRSAHTYVVLKHLGYERIRGYAGAWSEWGNDPDLPLER